MKASARLRLELPSPEEADAAAKALRPDDGRHARTSAEGSSLLVEAFSETPMGLLRTLDDTLAALRALGIP